MKHNLGFDIPIEILRSVVVISETGSISKAASQLSLSQPAISSHVKRIQTALGGDLFLRSPNGSTVTELGKLVLDQARRILEANDHILRLGGGAFRQQQPLRLGVNNLFMSEIFNCQSAQSLRRVVVTGGNSGEIAQGLLNGYIDIACIFASDELAHQVADVIVREAAEEFTWVRSRNFVLSPGEAIPILTDPGNITDALMIRTLKQNGLAYRVAFNSADNLARISAAKAGMGITAFPARIDPSPLVAAKEYYLPKLPLLKILLCARRDLHSSAAATLLNSLSQQFFDTPLKSDMFAPVRAALSA